MALNIVLVEPEIPQNTGNIARTCAATGSVLHLVRPLGFALTDKNVKRAGLDYWEDVEIVDYPSLSAFLTVHGSKRLWMATTKGNRTPDKAAFQDGDFILFGRETGGLPESLLKDFPETWVRLPMKDQTRSLNLSNAVAILTYEALRQMDWAGLQTQGPGISLEL